MEEDPYVRFCRLDRVIDGDTVDMYVDLGWNLQQKVRFRLLGVDTPELRSSDSDERVKARVAKDYVLSRLLSWSDFGPGRNTPYPLWVESHKTGKYGRWLATVGSRDPEEFFTLNELLLTGGYARPYMT